MWLLFDAKSESSFHSFYHQMLGSALKSRKTTGTASAAKRTAKPKEPKEKVHKFSESEIKDLKTAFGLLDKNDDGQLSVSEIEEMLENLGMPLDEELINLLVKEASKTGNMALTETEFMQWIHKIQMIREDPPKSSKPDPSKEEEDLRKDLLAAFSVFDLDGNGIIDKEELQNAMKIIDETITEDQLTELFKMADIDKDGKINYEDFLNILL